VAQAHAPDELPVLDAPRARGVMLRVFDGQRPQQARAAGTNSRSRDTQGFPTGRPADLNPDAAADGEPFTQFRRNSQG
jgi:hypothetical protein